MEIKKLYPLLLLLFIHTARAEEKSCTPFIIKKNLPLKIQHKDWINAQFSPDGKSVITASSEGTAIIKNLENGSEIIIQHKDWVKSAQFSPDGKSVVTASGDGTALIKNLENGNEIKIQHKNEVNSARFSPDGKSVITAFGDRTVLIKNLENGNEIKIQYKNGVNSAQLSPDGKSVITASSDRTTIIKNLENGSEIIIQHKDWVKSAQFSPDGKSVITVSGDGTALIKNLENGNETKIQHNNYVHSAQFSPDGKSVITVSNDGTALIKNLENGNEIKIQYKRWINSAQFSPDGKSVLIVGPGGVMLTSLNSICATNHILLQKESNDCMACAPSLPEGSISLNHEKELNNITLKAYCENDFNQDAWSAITPEIKNPKELSRDEARKYLLRFQKTNGFTPEKHLPIMLAVLKSDLAKKEPELILKALVAIFLQSPDLYYQLLNIFPDILKVKPQQTAVIACQNETEKQQTRDDLIKFLKEFSNEHRDNLEFKDIESIAPFLKNLSDAEKEEWLNIFTESLVARAKKWGSPFRDVFASKLYKFSENALAPLFGKEAPHLTDLTGVVESGSVTPILLSSSGIDGDQTRSLYGFYAKILPPITNPEKISQTEITWKTEEKKYRGSLELEKLKSKDFISNRDGPDYQSLWKDNTLTGVVFAGNNLGAGESQSLMHEYLAYYQDQGFEFNPKVRDIENVPQFLKEKIESGEMDYLVKEAHSDGDEKNIFKINMKARYDEGVKLLPNGKKEKIYLIYPDFSDSRTMLLGNNEFGSWIQKRERNQQGQLVFMNMSCWSMTKAVHEIQATQSSLLLDIPTVTTVYGLLNKETSASYQLLQSLRSGKNYDEIRSALSLDEKYKSKKGNYIIFPDEELYKTTITKRVADTPKITINILDSEGKPYTVGD